MAEFELVDSLCQIDNPFTWSAIKRDLFVKSCREVTQYFYDHSDVVRSLYERNQFHPRLIVDESALSQIPKIHLMTIRAFDLLLVEKKEVLTNLETPSTPGRFIKRQLDQKSSIRQLTILKKMLLQRKICDRGITNYLIFTENLNNHDQELSFNLRSMYQIAPEADTYQFHLSSHRPGRYDVKILRKKLQECCKENLPVTIISQPGAAKALIEQMVELDFSVNLPAGSLFVTDALYSSWEDNSHFRTEVNTRLGVSDEKIIDVFRLPEFGPSLITCRNHKFHVPAFCHVIIRDLDSGRVVKDGATGIIQLITPVNTVTPSISMLLPKLGAVDTASCDCNYESPQLKFVKSTKARAKL